MMSKLFILACFTIALLGCNSSSNQRFDNIPTETLEYEIVDVDLEDVYFPYCNLIYRKPYLVCLDARGDYWLKVIDIKHNEVYPFIRKGAGPKERIFLYSLRPSFRDRREFYLYDPQKKEVIFLNVDTLLNVGLQEDIVKLPVENIVYNVYSLNDTSYIVSGELEGNTQLLHLSISGEYHQKLYKYPDNPVAKTQVDEKLRGAVYNLKGAIRPDGKKVVFSMDRSDYYRINNINNGELEEEFEYYSFLPEYSLNEPTTRTMNERGGFLICSGGMKHFYMTGFEHFNILSSKESRMVYRNTLYEFTWDGKLSRKYKSDIPLGLFTVADDDSCIYALSPDPTLKLFRIEMY